MGKMATGALGYVSDFAILQSRGDDTNAAAQSGWQIEECSPNGGPTPRLASSHQLVALPVLSIWHAGALIHLASYPAKARLHKLMCERMMKLVSHKSVYVGAMQLK